jgi:hypothetical protein
MTTAAEMAGHVYSLEPLALRAAQKQSASRFSPLTQHSQNGLSRLVGAVRLAEALSPRDEQPHARVQNHQDHHRQQEKHHAARLVQRKIVRHIEHAAKSRLLCEVAGVLWSTNTHK